MDADKLYKIVKDVPREAWPPEPLRFEPNAENGRPSPGWEIGGYVFPYRLLPDHVELMFIGSMTKRQIEGGGRIPTVAMSGKYSIWSPILKRYCYFDTLIEALAGACIEVESKESGRDA